MTAEAVAAIDCGTNSIRLLIARVADGRLVDIERRMVAVRLGEGVDRTGHLSPVALERTFAACRDYRTLIERHGAARTRFVATSASRDADNAAEFADGVLGIFAVAPEVITGQEEAELSFTGATKGVAHDEPVLVFDIGGGSTEFVIGDRQPAAATSVDLGCVRFTERYARHDPISRDELGEVLSACDHLLDVVDAQVAMDRARSVIGLAGTVTTVTALALGLRVYDAQRIHRSAVPLAAVKDVTHMLVSMSAAERARLPVMHPGRADVIAVGAVILDRILARTSVSQMIASEHDILDGIAWSLIRAHPSDTP